MVNPKRLFSAFLCVAVVSAIFFYSWLQARYVVPILMYHSISSNTPIVHVLGYPGPLQARLNVVSPMSFERQMKSLVDHGYHVISLDDYVKGQTAGKRFPHNTVVITFDDGYVDNYTHAFPILKKYHLPATIFLISDIVGESPSVLNWAQVKEMQENGISFGSHTRRHAYLPSQSHEQLKDEIAGSKQILEKQLGQPVEYIAYPCGGFTEEAKAICALAGYKAALTTNRGYDRYNIDLYELSRIHMNNGDKGFVLFSKFSGFYNLFRELKPSH